MDLSDTESLEAEPTATPLPAQSASSFAAARSAMAQSAAAAAQDAPSEEEEEEETPTPAPPVKRGRPKGSKDAQPRTRTKPVHTPSKQYVDAHDTVHQNSPTELRCEAPSLRHYEEAMEHARQREVNRRQTMYESWLPY